MDWNSTSPTSPRVHLAITKLPARVPVTDPRYGGLLWLQTGGPGSSGVGFASNHAKTAQMIVDSPLDPSSQTYDKDNPPKYYDVLGMDPRGVNNTRPSFTCFPGVMAREVWQTQSSAEGILWSSESANLNLWARNKALGQGCTERAGRGDDNGASLAFHMGTSSLVGDIVHVIEEHGRWREQQGSLLKSKVESSLLGPSAKELTVMRERIAWQRGEEKLLYWGLSYGTIVGATFAAMQPHRVSCAILDGVADAPDYYRNEWMTNLDDTDVILDKFSLYCSQAGPSRCPFYTPGGPEAIKVIFHETVEFLKGDPIGVFGTGAIYPDIVTYTDMKWLIREAVYSPLQYWPRLAQVLSDLSYRNGTSFAILKQRSPSFTIPASACHNAAPYTPGCAVTPNTTPLEVSTAILCSDGDARTQRLSFPAFMEYATALRDRSWLIGDSWAQIRMSCNAWNITPSWRFPGPFASNVTKPMLIVNNKVDPVTPLRNAKALAERFPGSRVLETEGEGHCMFTAPSLCAARAVKAYFQSGILPEVGSKCGVSERAFVGVLEEPRVGEEELWKKMRWSALNFFA